MVDEGPSPVTVAALAKEVATGDVAIMAGPFIAKLWPDDGSPMSEVVANAIGMWRCIDEEWRITSFQVTMLA
jgi:hypothetical protein